MINLHVHLALHPEEALPELGATPSLKDESDPEEALPELGAAPKSPLPVFMDFKPLHEIP